MTRCINDVDAVAGSGKGLGQSFFLLLRPETRDRGRRDGYAALAFLLHPVRHRIAVIHIANFVDQTGIKEDALRGRRFAGIDVRRDPDVAGAFHRVLPLRRVH